MGCFQRTNTRQPLCSALRREFLDRRNLVRDLAIRPLPFYTLSRPSCLCACVCTHSDGLLFHRSSPPTLLFVAHNYGRWGTHNGLPLPKTTSFSFPGFFTALKQRKNLSRHHHHPHPLLLPTAQKLRALKTTTRKKATALATFQLLRNFPPQLPTPCLHFLLL